MKYKFTDKDRQKSNKCKKEIWEKKWKETPFEELRLHRQRKIILEEQGYLCSICGQGEIWNGKKLVLQIDHIDGDAKNRKRKNSRMICPNCHTQTETYCTRNVRGEKKERMLRGFRKHNRGVSQR